MKKFFVSIFMAMLAISASASVVDFIERVDGGFDVFIDGVRNGGVSASSAERVANTYKRQGNTVNWASGIGEPDVSVYTTGGGGTAASKSTSASGTTNSGKAGGTTVNTKGTTSTTFEHNGKQYTYETTANGQSRYKDPTTGRYTKKPDNMLPATTNNNNLPAATTSGGKNLPATTNSSSSGTGGGNTLPSNPAGGGAKVSAAKVASGALGVVGIGVGAYEIYKSGEAKEEKATWSDVARGASGGFSAASGTTMVLNAIPGIGNIAYGAIVAVGTVAGASWALTKMFSETDCATDPVMGKQACCNISKLSNIQATRIAIGGKMFCDWPGVRTCVQGKKEFETEQSWLKGRFLDDHWSDTCKEAFCPGYVKPEPGDYNIQRFANTDDVCWFWECADDGMVRQGGKCVPGGNKDRAVGAPCSDLDLKKQQYATAGVYIKSGDGVVCAATACKDKTYLVLNSDGVSQGWCVAGTFCDNRVGTRLNIIDSVKTDLECVPDVTDVADEQVPEAAPQEQNPVNPCVAGVDGFVMFEGQCISVDERNQILAERQQQAQQAQQAEYLRSKIKSNKTVLDSMIADFDVSVWRNEEGKFNTARLASDSIAGVVLGTAGGLITNKIIKKNQTKKGLEGIQCTVGGQVVADFGDVFKVE